MYKKILLVVNSVKEMCVHIHTQCMGELHYSLVVHFSQHMTQIM